MLPGPGSYDGKPELVERFHRPPMPRLRPRQPVAVPRKKIMVATLDIIDTPSQREPEGKKISSSPQSLHAFLGLTCGISDLYIMQEYMT